MVLATWGFCAAALPGQPARAQMTEATSDFRTNCASCHTIGGGRLAGPDLKEVLQRRDRAWLGKFIPDPKAVIDSGDSYAQQLLQEARGVVMPTLPGMNPARVNHLLDLIEAEARLPKSKFAGETISDRPFTKFDVANGERLFLGYTRLKGGGPACVSCHAAQDAGGIGGGALGPDLTKVFERIGGRKSLATWLSAPATSTMQAVFRKHPMESDEIEALVAFFQDAAQKPVVAQTRGGFVMLGVVGALALTWGLNQIWSGRLRGVRRAMVERCRLPGT